MNPMPLSAPPSMINRLTSEQTAAGRLRGRTVLIVSPDSGLRGRLHNSLSGLRWHVLEAPGGAEAWLASQSAQLDALLIDSWLPDLDVGEFLGEIHRQHPLMDLLMTDGVAAEESPRGPYHQELLYALRRSHEGDTAAWNAAPVITQDSVPSRPVSLSEFSHKPAAPSSRWQTLRKEQEETSVHSGSGSRIASAGQVAQKAIAPDALAERDQIGSTPNSMQGLPTFESAPFESTGKSGDSRALPATVPRRERAAVERIPELIGSSSAMLEVSRRIRLVAARATPVLIEGPTGTGKELVAEALHRLSGRNRKPFIAINCAAIPEALLEAELFGHTRGAFTGAVQGRTGRIEAAEGGTLFLDEIGEMPLSLQSKLLRFFESGELQRIGDNETVKVDVRIVAATHQPLAEDAQKGRFRADLYYRLAVFLIHTPALVEHMEDLPLLVAHFVERLGRKAPVKRVEDSAMTKLLMHGWPGNVRELEHVLERAAILAGDEPVITAAEIDFGLLGTN